MAEEVRIPLFFVHRRPPYEVDGITDEPWPEFVTVWRTPGGRTAMVRQAIAPDAYEEALQRPDLASELMRVVALSWDPERFEAEADRLVN